MDTDRNYMDIFYMANPTPGAPNDRNYLAPIPLYGEEDTCHNNMIDEGEIGEDCGGVCAPCPDGSICENDSDCISGFCIASYCEAQPNCEDWLLNQNETDVDCGGICPGCPDGATCGVNSDCHSLFCNTSGICETLETCSDRILNQNESDIDCGGVCDPCANGLRCNIDVDCESNRCVDEICVPPAITASIDVYNPWSTGYCAYINLINETDEAVNGWQVILNTNESSIYHFWNGIFSMGPPIYTVTSESYNSDIPVGGTVQLGFCANHTGTNWQPEIISVSSY